LRIAGFAGSYDVPTRGLATTANRDDVVHRQKLAVSLFLAVITNSYVDFLLPPL
jgi:hypothetical protein